MFGDDSDDNDNDQSQHAADARENHENLNTIVKEPYGVVREAPVGGGRGVFARDNIASGSLIVAEIASMTFADSNNLDDPAEFQRTMQQICESKLAFECCSVLHPRDLDLVDPVDVQRVKENWSSDELLNLTSSSGTPRDDVLRVALALQHNGFASGLYHTLTMINHSCSPNCIKFAPKASSRYASEIWTVRPIRMGEELTICYCEPAEMTPLSMREYLSNQHRFKCMCQLCEKLKLVEMEENSAAVSVATDGGKTVTVWQEYDDVHDSLASMEKELRFSEIDDAADVMRIGKRMMRLCTSLVGKCEGMHQAASIRDVSGDSAVVTPPINRELLDRTQLVTRVRILKVIAQAAALSLEAFGLVTGVKRSVLRGAIISYVGASLALLGLQERYLGPDHCDLSTTHSDIEEGLRCALQHFEVGASTSTATDFSLQGLLKELAAAPYCVPMPPTVDRAFLEELMAQSAGEAQRLKRLYNTKHRYSGLGALAQPGDVWWGGHDAEK